MKQITPDIEIIEKVTKQEFNDAKQNWENQLKKYDLSIKHWLLEVGEEEIVITTDLTRAFENIKLSLKNQNLYDENILHWFVWGYDYAKKTSE